jgi:outer membrane protein OmpA-like peptidoglycan-associated protein
VRLSSHLLAGLVLITGCGSTTGLGVPHEDPEPIGSAPWEMGADDPKDSSSPDEDAQARTAARNRARKGRHEKPVAAAPSASLAPSAQPTVKADADGDGVEDARDMCPMKPGPDDPNPAWAGCPYDAPPRPTPDHSFEELNLAFGDAPRSLDPKESETMKSLADEMKSEPAITLSTYALTKGQGDGWIKIVKASLVQGGVDPSRITTQVCLQKSGLTHTVVTRGKKACE